MACDRFENFCASLQNCCGVLSDEQFKQLVMDGLCCLVEAGGSGGGSGEASRAAVVDGYTGTTAIGATTSITFASPVRDVSFWSNSTNTVPITYTIVGAGGNKTIYVPAGGSNQLAIDAGFITGVSFVNNSTTAAMVYTVSGVDGGVL